jgi:hypothetical protein
VSTCSGAVKNLACDGDMEKIAACDFPAGKLAAGAACVDDEQCASEFCKKGDNACGACAALVAIGGVCSPTEQCVKGADCRDGKCVAEIRNAAGGSCDASKSEYCQSGLFCDFTTKTCKAPGAVGAACSSSAPCQRDLSCDATSKTCVKATLAAEGQACSGTVRCQSGLVCDPSAAKCAKLTIVAPGGDCSGLLTKCGTGSCNEATNKCPTVIPDGAACVVDDASQTCDVFADCLQGKCQFESQVVCK